ncbi:formylglycine-generating enzyme family protein [bacterium]|nr:formylglycine-generating enzyme family protein [bacterium]
MTRDRIIRIAMAAAALIFAGGCFTGGHQDGVLTGDTSPADDDGDDRDDTIDDDEDADDDSGESRVPLFAVTIDRFGIRWIRVPAGSYTMGCSPADFTCGPAENTVEVKIPHDFLVMQHELTNREFFEVFGKHPDPDEPSEHPEHPFHGNWTIARPSEICAQIGARLPTDREWEYVARAGTTTRYYCGTDPACLDDIAWWSGNTPAQGKDDFGALPVGQKAPNPWGFFDILGNAWEMVDDYQDCGDGYISAVARGGDVTSDAYNMRVSMWGLAVECGGPALIGIRCAKKLENDGSRF